MSFEEENPPNSTDSKDPTSQPTFVINFSRRPMAEKALIEGKKFAPGITLQLKWGPPLSPKPAQTPTAIQTTPSALAVTLPSNNDEEKSAPQPEDGNGGQ